MIHKCRLPRSIQAQVKEFSADPKLRQGLGYDAYKEAAKQLEVIMGMELLETMSEVDTQHEGIWMMSRPSWEAITKTASADLEIETVSKLTQYTGVQGYFHGWPIIIGPGGPRYGVRFVFEAQEGIST